MWRDSQLSGSYIEFSLICAYLSSLLRERVQKIFLDRCESVVSRIEITSIKGASEELPFGKRLHLFDLVERFVASLC